MATHESLEKILSIFLILYYLIFIELKYFLIKSSIDYIFYQINFMHDVNF